MLKSSLTDFWNEKGVHAFLKSISPEVNVTGRLEFELAYFEAAVEHFSHYTTGTLPSKSVEYPFIANTPWSPLTGYIYGSNRSV